jgi:hypothetical protein
MGRAARFLGVVTFDCTFLVTVKRFDRVVGIENLWSQRKYRMSAAGKMLIKPGNGLCFIEM